MPSQHPAASRFFALFQGLVAFAELEERISALPSNQERGDAFEVFAEAYLATQKITQAQQVWPFEAIPLQHRKSLALDTKGDKGVDGIYQTSSHELRAYQVKFRSHRRPLTWEELSTFMGLTDQVSQRVLFTNSDELPPLMGDRSHFFAIRGNDLDRLVAEDFEGINLWLHGAIAQRQSKQPQLHQQDALRAIASGLKDKNRLTAVMACGTGKSLVALWAAEQCRCQTVLVLVPSLALVRQLLHEWLRETSWEKLIFLCVCSDASVAKGVDEVVIHHGELDFAVTTDSKDVSDFLKKPFDGVKVVFSTYQSAHVVADGMPLNTNGIKNPFDLAIFDEAHKTASWAGSYLSFALQDANLPIGKRIFFTATPRHYDVRKRDQEGDAALVYSMDQPDIYGPIVYTLSFAEAARRNIICNYKVIISVITSEMVSHHLLRFGEVLIAGDAVEAQQVAVQIALKEAVAKYGMSRIFTFHSTVAAARSFVADSAEGICQYLSEFRAFHVSGAMTTAERELRMKSFRQAEHAVMSNARCLTEGVDVPSVDMVAFMSPRKSKVDIVQATGRAMRNSPGKEVGYVMVPVFLNVASNETLDEALRRSNFSDVWEVLAAMCEQDDLLTDTIDQMREERGRTGGYNEVRFRERVEVLGPSVSLEIIRRSIVSQCIDNLGASWDERYGELIKYKEEFGDCNVSSIDPAWFQLGRSVSNQRGLYLKRKLSAYREVKLRSLDFD